LLLLVVDGQALVLV